MTTQYTKLILRKTPTNAIVGSILNLIGVVNTDF